MAVVYFALMLVVPANAPVFFEVVLLCVGFHLQEGRLYRSETLSPTGKRGEIAADAGRRLARAFLLRKIDFRPLAFAIELSRYNPLDE